MEKETQEIKNNHKLFKNEITRKHQKVTFVDLKPQTFYEIKIEAMFNDHTKITSKKMAFTPSSGFMDSVEISSNQNKTINKSQSDPNADHFLFSKRYGTFNNQNTVLSPENGVSYSEKEFINELCKKNDPFTTGMMGGRKKIENHVLAGRQSKGIKEFVNAG